MKPEALEKLQTRAAAADEKAKQLKARLVREQQRTKRQDAKKRRDALAKLKYTLGGEILSRGRQVEETVKTVLSKVENAERRAKLEQAFDDFMFARMKAKKTATA